jgi:hypothetical protein
MYTHTHTHTYANMHILHTHTLTHTHTDYMYINIYRGTVRKVRLASADTSPVTHHVACVILARTWRDL